MTISSKMPESSNSVKFVSVTSVQKLFAEHKLRTTTSPRGVCVCVCVYSLLQVVSCVCVWLFKKDRLFSRVVLFIIDSQGDSGLPPSCQPI